MNNDPEFKKPSWSRLVKAPLLGMVCLMPATACSGSGEPIPSPTVTETVYLTSTPVPTDSLARGTSNPIAQEGQPLLPGAEESIADASSEIVMVRSSDASVYFNENSVENALDQEYDPPYFTNPWVPGFATQIMIEYGCTGSGYYKPDPDCPVDSEGNHQGSHHGVDLYYPTGTEIVLPHGYTATRVDPKVNSAGKPGNAYGEEAVRLRVSSSIDGSKFDLVIGHTIGDDDADYDETETLLPGDVISIVGDDGAPDGPHLHFEVRPIDGDYSVAIDPSEVLGLAEYPG